MSACSPPPPTSPAPKAEVLTLLGYGYGSSRGQEAPRGANKREAPHRALENQKLPRQAGRLTPGVQAQGCCRIHSESCWTPARKLPAGSIVESSVQPARRPVGLEAAVAETWAHGFPTPQLSIRCRNKAPSSFRVPPVAKPAG